MVTSRSSIVSRRFSCSRDLGLGARGPAGNALVLLLVLQVDLRLLTHQPHVHPLEDDRASDPRNDQRHRDDEDNPRHTHYIEVCVHLACLLRLCSVVCCCRAGIRHRRGNHRWCELERKGRQLDVMHSLAVLGHFDLAPHQVRGFEPREVHVEQWTAHPHVPGELTDIIPAARERRDDAESLGVRQRRQGVDELVERRCDLSVSR